MKNLGRIIIAVALAGLLFITCSRKTPLNPSSNDNSESISSSTSSISISAGNMKVLIPAYIYPTLPDWSRMVTQSAKMPGRIWAIANPNSGPGASVNSDYTAGISNMRSSGGRVIGYVSTSYASRSSALVMADVSNWYSFYPGIDGIFLDEYPWVTNNVNYYQSLYSNIRAIDSGALIVGNPGGDVQEPLLMSGGVRSADLLCVFETSPGFNTWTGLSWYAFYAPSNFSVIPYNVASSNWQQYTDRAYNLGMGWIYCADDVLPNPWDTLPSYFEAQCDYIKQQY